MASDPTLVGALFSKGPIEIVVQRVQGQQVRLGIQAHEHRSCAFFALASRSA